VLCTQVSIICRLSESLTDFIYYTLLHLQMVSVIHGHRYMTYVRYEIIVSFYEEAWRTALGQVGTLGGQSSSCSTRLTSLSYTGGLTGANPQALRNYYRWYLAGIVVFLVSTSVQLCHIALRSALHPTPYHSTVHILVRTKWLLHLTQLCTKVELTNNKLQSLPFISTDSIFFRHVKMHTVVC
jgi:hypothetical protein